MIEDENRIADRLAIMALNDDFGRLLDHGDVTGFVALFTEDVRYSNGPRALNGREEMTEFFTARAAGGDDDRRHAGPAGPLRHLPPGCQGAVHLVGGERRLMFDRGGDGGGNDVDDRTGGGGQPRQRPVAGAGLVGPARRVLRAVAGGDSTFVVAVDQHHLDLVPRLRAGRVLRTGGEADDVLERTEPGSGQVQLAQPGDAGGPGLLRRHRQGHPGGDLCRRAGPIGRGRLRPGLRLRLRAGHRGGRGRTGRLELHRLSGHDQHYRVGHLGQQLVG